MKLSGAGFAKAAILASLALCGWSTAAEKQQLAPLPEVPPFPREFRAAWVATVANIDWPSKPGLSTDEQKAEIVAILDKSQEIGLNAIVLQVRTSADALYPSKYEPWSYFLTGEQGKAPEPFYDPLKFWVEQAHARGIQLHAWFNPYRARQSGQKYEESEKHVSKTNPKIVAKYGPYLWLNPAEKQAEELSYNVFMDVLKRYDVDGIHIDDYFYPYPVQGEDKKDVPFPDAEQYEAYKAKGGKRSVEDWRREQINHFIERIYKGIKKEKPQVLFGISPFGLPYGETMPSELRGFNQYEKLYADAILWLNKGWLDYWTPQLYWPIQQKGQQFPILLDYWAEQNVHGRHLWPGLFTSRVGDGSAKAWDVSQVADQIELTRWRPQAGGHVHFSMKAIMQNRDNLADVLGDDVYEKDAIVPATPWLDAKVPAAPALELEPTEDGAIEATVAPKGRRPQDAPFVYTLYVRYGDTWTYQVLPAKSPTVTLRDHPHLGPVTMVAAGAVSRTGNESERVAAIRPSTLEYPTPTTQPTTMPTTAPAVSAEGQVQ